MKNFILGAFVLLSSITYGQNTWNTTTTKSIDDVVFITSRMPSTYQLFNINVDNIKEVLKGAPIRHHAALKNSETILSFPNKEGEFEFFRIQEAPIMTKELAAKFPMIKTYVGQGIDDPTATLRMSIGTDGLHIMIRAADKASFFIDPYTKNRDKYIAYSADDLPVLHQFNCEFDQEKTFEHYAEINTAVEKNLTDGKMREYNLAVATTIEYSAYHLTNQGIPGGATTAVKKAAVLSAITNTINRVTGIYETELGVTFVLNANEDAIIFIDSDNFSNDDTDFLIDESQVEIDNIIGNANYDVGHTFGTGGGGLAFLGGICTVSLKAKAITGSQNPIGDFFDVDFVAHEIGHHFGANHSYNGENGSDPFSSCTTSNPGTAAEPGSGTTIMAYAGICTAINVQQNSNAYFHIVSLKEINNRLTNTGDYTHSFYAQCSTDTNTGNQEPIANAGIDYTIPKGTAFVLYGSANDPDGDAMTYCWDQIDLQQPNIYPLASTTTTGPLYRSFTPTVTNIRYMPKFETVFGGSLATDWEVTPTVGRDLNFSLTVRDNRADGGQNTSDDVLITVSGVAGPFEVTSQGTEEIWATGETKTITWNVAGTTANGVNATQVEITLIDETGGILDILQASTPNDGSHSITVPNVMSNNTRIKVTGVGHIFYAINSAVIAVNTAPGYCATLCASSGSTQFSDGTTLVTFNNINNASTGAPSYSDFTAMSTDVVKGQSYNLTVNVNTDGGFTELTKVWIDWNRDCMYDANEEYELGTASSTTDGPTFNSPLSITIPASADIGETVMRVSSAYNNGGFIPSLCDQGFLGEVEDYTINILAGPLPIVLTHFQAKPINGKAVQLDWQTVSELNNAGFELERSTDARLFKAIIWVDGNGTSTERNNYQYIDKTVENNQLYYYRLKQIDFDGLFDYSTVKTAIIRNNHTQIMVYPNPATDLIYIQTGANSHTATETVFRLFDALGQEVIVQSINGRETAVSVGHLPTGIYFYKIGNGNDVLKSDKLLVN